MVATSPRTILVARALLLCVLALPLFGCGSESGSTPELGAPGGTGGTTIDTGGTSTTAGSAAASSSVVPPVPRGNCTDITIPGIGPGRWAWWITLNHLHVLFSKADTNVLEPWTEPETVSCVDSVDLTQLGSAPVSRHCGLYDYGGVYAVAGSPSGAILLDAISDNLEFPGYRNDNLLLGHLDSSDFQEVHTPWTEPDAVVMSIRWDGEAFVVITYTTEGQLAAARFSEQGENLTPLTLIGPGINTGRDESADVAVDTNTGFIALVDMAFDGIKLVAFGRDLVAVREGGMLYGVLEPSDEEPLAMNSSVNTVAVRSDSVLALYTVIPASRVSRHHRAQRFGLDLTPVGPNIHIPPYMPPWSSYVMPYASIAAVQYQGFWYVAASSAGGIMLLLLDDEGVVSQQLLVSNDSASCIAPNECPMDTFPMRQLGFTEAGGKLWLHFFDISNYGGTSSNYRIVEASPDCMHLSARDKVHWAE